MVYHERIKVQAGAGDISDPIIDGILIKLTNREAVIKWKYPAYYTTGHIGLEFGPLRRVYTRKEYDHLCSYEAGYHRIRITPPPLKTKKCSTCGHVRTRYPDGTWSR